MKTQNQPLGHPIKNEMAMAFEGDVGPPTAQGVRALGRADYG